MATIRNRQNEAEVELATNEPPNECPYFVHLERVGDFWEERVNWPRWANRRCRFPSKPKSLLAVKASGSTFSRTRYMSSPPLDRPWPSCAADGLRSGRSPRFSGASRAASWLRDSMRSLEVVEVLPLIQAHIKQRVSWITTPSSIR